MLSSARRLWQRGLSFLPVEGFHFDRPIIILQSDDWGRIGLRDQLGLDSLRSAGLVKSSQRNIRQREIVARLETLRIASGRAGKNCLRQFEVLSLRQPGAAFEQHFKFYSWPLEQLRQSLLRLLGMSRGDRAIDFCSKRSRAWLLSEEQHAGAGERSGSSGRSPAWRVWRSSRPW